MSKIRHCLLTAAACVVAIPASVFGDLVDLSFDPEAQTAWLDDLVEIDLIASSNDDEEQLFASIEAILSWDPVYLDFIGVDDSSAGYPFLPNHFMPDPDGINDDLHDGDALFIALAQPGEEASAPPEGLVVTTLQFQALAETDGTVVSFLPLLGDHGVTRVRRLDLTDVTGDISGTATITIVCGCVGDLDGDCDVDHSDLGILLASWQIDDGGDLDGDFDTDHSDLGILLADWGCGVSP